MVYKAILQQYNEVPKSRENSGLTGKKFYIPCITILRTCKPVFDVSGDSFGIKEPFPESIYPIEGTSAQVTCVAFDSSGMKIPERIQFVRKDIFARYTNVTETENIELEEMRGPIDQGELFSTFQSILGLCRLCLATFGY